MANAITLVDKFLPILDEQYKLGAKTSILDTPPEFIQQTSDAKKYKVAKLTTVGLANYSRSTGFVTGDTTLTWEEKEYTIDRGRSLQIDDMDNQETMGLAFGRLAGEFNRIHVIPEIDAYRFATYAAKAGITATETCTAANIVSSILDAQEKMYDAEVGEGAKYLFISPACYTLLMTSSEIDKYLEVDRGGDANLEVRRFNGLPIIKVPSARFNTKVTLNNATASTGTGGFTVSGQKINYMIISAASAIQTVKHSITRVWAPSRAKAAGTDGVNPNGDMWKFDLRIYHDAWVLDNAVNGIALSAPAAASGG